MSKFFRYNQGISGKRERKRWFNTVSALKSHLSPEMKAAPSFTTSHGGTMVFSKTLPLMSPSLNMMEDHGPLRATTLLSISTAPHCWYATLNPPSACQEVGNQNRVSYCLHHHQCNAASDNIIKVCVCVCSCTCFILSAKILILRANWGHFCWSSQL